jgi:GTP-binding protein
MAKITAEFIKSVKGTNDIMYDGKPQIVFIGRSNVGKSSLINSLVGKQLARSSSNPGKTVNIDFFLVNNERYFVDLPGYGFARVSAKEKEDFRKMILWYLSESNVDHLLIILIIDAKVGLTEFDRESIEFLTYHHKRFIVVANKIDRLAKNDRAKYIASVKKDCGDIPVVGHSLRTSAGKSEIIKYCLAMPPKPLAEA